MRPQDLSRWACAVFAVATFIAVPAHAAKKAPQPAPFGDWQISESIDKLTNKKKCSVIHAKLPYVFSNESGNLLYISFHRRGGLDSYRTRIGTAVASELKIASELERSTSVLTIRLFEDEIGDANRVIVQGLTITRDPIDEDISLTGYREARAEMRKRCS